ncbi:DNA primase [Patescibacteria group bacterium]|nr:DNA primase [Patescibacteria group bacterium]
MSQIQEVKQATDIVQLISERVSLQRSGANWRGLCPFHSEKSPSFFVSEQLQRYRCFGCGKSGDAFTFLEEYEGMTFAEALQYLADRAGITLTKQTFTDEDEQRKRLLEILNLSREYYHFLLTEHDVGKKGMAYLKDRGLSQESIKVFQLGYALSQWDGLLKYLHGKKKYSLADIQAAGLIIKGQGGRSYDRFRDRIMFPLTDHRGRVVGFSGRVLDPAVKEAKYINTPETMLYHKSQLLFGYSQLYQEIRKENEVVVVEGEFDVISSAQAHVNNVVAVKGSALTEEHMRLLSRTVERVLLCFDTDSAGIEATRRAIAVAKPFGIELRVLDFGDHAQKDPDELARTNPQLWRQIAKSSVSVYEFLMRAALKEYDPATPEGKRKIVNQLAPVFSQISHAVEREYYVRKLAEALEVKENALQLDLQKFGVAKSVAGGSRSSGGAQAEPKQAAAPQSSRRTRLEHYLLFLLFQADAAAVPSFLKQVLEFEWQLPAAKHLVVALAKHPIDEHWSLQNFARGLAEDLQQRLFEITAEEEFLQIIAEMDQTDREKEFAKEWQKALADLTQFQVSEQTAAIQARLDELDGLPEKTPEQEAEQMQLLQQVVQLRGKKV